MPQPQKTGPMRLQGSVTVHSSVYGGITAIRVPTRVDICKGGINHMANPVTMATSNQGPQAHILLPCDSKPRQGTLVWATGILPRLLTTSQRKAAIALAHTEADHQPWSEVSQTRPPAISATWPHSPAHTPVCLCAFSENLLLPG